MIHQEAVSAKFFDGTSARQHAALVHMTERRGTSVLVIEVAGRPEEIWPVSDLREVTDQARDEGIVLRHGQDGIARLIVPHGHSEDVIRAAAPDLGKKVVSQSMIRKLVLWIGGAAASVAHLKVDQDLRDQHQTQAKILKLRLKGLGLPIIDHGSHIVPLIVGDPVHTKKLSDMLLSEFGIYVQPINFPTVPRGTERLRFTPSPVHGPREMDALVGGLDKLWSHCALNRAELAG